MDSPNAAAEAPSGVLADGSTDEVDWEVDGVARLELDDVPKLEIDDCVELLAVAYDTVLGVAPKALDFDRGDGVPSEIGTLETGGKLTGETAFGIGDAVNANVFGEVPEESELCE